MWGKPRIVDITSGDCGASITFYIKAQDHDIVIPKGTKLVSTEYDMTYVLPEDVILKCEPETLSWPRRIWWWIRKAWRWIRNLLGLTR